jgi:alkyl hydroperoxide reductase subunit AhpC
VIVGGIVFFSNFNRNKKEETMAALRLGDIAPDFEAETTMGKIRFHEWLGDSWGVLFSHIADFNPVCTTELGTASQYHPEFEKRNTKVMGLSVDDLDSHIKWIKDVNEIEKTQVNFPVIADEDKRIATLYDMIHPLENPEKAVLSVFVISREKKIKVIFVYPPSTGRNFDEILRVIDSLQLTSEYNVVTPANWKFGMDVVISPLIPDNEIPELFPLGYQQVKPYFRLTPQPNTNGNGH